MEVKEFWRQYEIADKEHKKWEKRAEKVIKRYRLEEGNATPSFNILWANTSVLQPALFSQVPKPDITRRYKDDDPVGAHGSKIIERCLDFVMDDGDFFTFGSQSVLDYLLPGRTVSKCRYVPTYSTVRKAIPVEQRMELGEEGEDPIIGYFMDDEKLDPAEVKRNEEGYYVERDYEEVVDEHVEIERWPWKNFRHQRARRWKDVGWIDFISYLDSDQLKKLFGRKYKDIELTVDGTGDENKDGSFKPTHAEVHEVWVARERKVYLAVRGVEDTWFKEGGDPLRLEQFFPTPKPLMAIDTNDSLQPIPMFALYQHQANELDKITRRISILMDALKMAGLYAGSEKDTLTKLFMAEENTMIPVADWSAIQGAGGVSKLVDWLPIEQVGKVLSALFREREAIVTQIFELTGIADIQRGSTDPRETKGAQVLKAQFTSRRTLTPKQEVERYFRDVLRKAAEIIAEHFSIDTLERMTGLPVPIEVRQMLKDDLQRQYRIDVETDSTVAPDEERDQANMAKALEAVTAYVQAIAPLAQQGVIDATAAIQLLKVYLRKFRWGREIEETLEMIERNPPQQKPDPEQQKMMMEAQLKQQESQQKFALEQQKAQLEVQKQQAELQLKVQEMQMKIQALAMKMEVDKAQGEQKMMQSDDDHQMDMIHSQEQHQQALIEQHQLAMAKQEAMSRGNTRGAA